jgi:hypothetical protein
MRASDQVEPGNVIAHNDATHMSGWKYICRAMKGIKSPFAVRNMRAVRFSPPPSNPGGEERGDAHEAVAKDIHRIEE